MKDSTRIALINKEIETYRKFAVVLESLKPVIQSFDGKCINKKFAEAMDKFYSMENLKDSIMLSQELTQHHMEVCLIWESIVMMIL